MTHRRDSWFDRQWAIAFCLYLLVLLVITLAAYLDILPTQLAAIPSYDTLGHFFLMGIASYLSYLALRGRMICVWRCAMPLGPALIGAIVIVDETLQAFSPYRTVSVTDVAASFSGILLFYRLARAQLILKH
ncbi:MAG: VanZ family protein [Oculatellaceae cyanobacterium bins.114]|nr:VanZ family protein [Oculatellaceae cyanobacterium bins.114]